MLPPGRSGRALALASLLLLVCVGCRSSHPFHDGILVRNHLEEDGSEHSPARFKAEYVLYRRPSLEEGGEELLSRSLVVADELGFAVETDALFAVSADERIALEPGLYCWHIRPGTGPSRLHYKARAVAGIAIGVGALSLVSFTAILGV